MKKIVGFVCTLLVITLGLLQMVHDDSVASEVVQENLDGQLTIHFLDIGQGDATFIVFPDGTQMLVDCSIDARILEALGDVMSFHDNTIDYLVITHPDKDHYGGCVDVLDRFDVGQVIYNGYEKQDSVFWLEFWDVIQAEQAEYTEVTQLTHWEIVSTSVQFLYPDHSLRDNPHIPGDESTTVDANNGSIVLLLSYGTVDVLMTGDAEQKLEEYLIEMYGDKLDVDVLKVGHHGSNTSSIDPLLAVTTPEHAVISVGVDNRYGHPSPRVLKRFERASSTIWRTDRQGTITLTTDGTQFSFSPER